MTVLDEPMPEDTSAADPDAIDETVSQDPNFVPEDFSGGEL